ncbi:MAG: TonB family protein, partial [Acidobacteriota bacterium]|nr:TonB family protein [Acidobacteriota bacterium]
MNRIPIVPAIFSLTLFSASVLSQNNDRVDVFTNIARPDLPAGCEKLEMGSPIESITPEYPPEARSIRLGGAVKVIAEVGSNGSVAKIKDSTGPEALQQAARIATLKTRFSVTRCDGVPLAVEASMTYNFVPFALTDRYVAQKKIEDFPDVAPDSPFYEAILTLTENYKLAFGYADGKYHADAPLTKGDFAHSLRLTLDLLQQRAEVA